MGAAIFTTGPYIQMTLGKSTPMSPVVEDGVVVWRVPLGQVSGTSETSLALLIFEQGAVPHVSLEDCAYYVRWLFDHQSQSNGIDLEVAIEHVDYHELAKAFTAVTGKPAKYIDTDLETYWKTGPLSAGASRPAGYNADVNDLATLTMQENFTGFWNLWKYSGGNKGVVKRDYALLDRIHPNRIKSAEEWFRLDDERGRKAGLGGLYERAANLKPVLKIAEDGRKGKI